MQSAGRPTGRPTDPLVPRSVRPPLSSHQHFESREITFLSSVHLTPPAAADAAAQPPPQYVNPSPSLVPVVQNFKAAAAAAAMVSQKQLC